MAKWISGATCAAAAFSLALTAGQVTLQASGQSRVQTRRDHAGDLSSATKKAADARQEATITGCVVRDAANAGQPTIASNGIAYKLAGKPDVTFDQYLGKRIEVTGLLDNGSTGARATSGKAVTVASVPPKDQTATGGQSDVTATGAPRDNTVRATSNTTNTPPAPDTLPLATDRGTTADLTGRMQVRTVRVVSPNCL